MWDSDQNSPYVKRPGSDRDAGMTDGERAGSLNADSVMPNSMAKAAYTTGIIAVVSLFTMLIYPAMILGSTAIVLALLSRNREGKMHNKAKSAITTGIVAIVADAILLAISFTLLFSNGDLKSEINNGFKEMYGQTFDDMWNDMKDGTLDLEYRNLPYGLSGGSSSNSGLQNDDEVSYNKNSTIV